MIIQKSKLKLHEPILICSWPGLGMVGNYVLNYIISQLKPTIYAQLNVDEYYSPHNILIQNGIISLPKSNENKFYYYKAQEYDLLFFLSDTQPSQNNMYKLAKEIINFAETLKVNHIITFAGMPSNIIHTDKPKLFIAQTEQNNNLGFNLPIMGYGIVEGMNGVILGVAKEVNINATCILAEIPVYTIDMENPQTSLRILKLFEKMFLLKFNFNQIDTDILNMEEKIKVIFEELNQKAQKLITQFDTPHNTKNKYDVVNIPGVSFEELKKRIKFSIPESAKNKIDELFKLSAQDIKYAKELKDELDRWGVYKDYEDKFLNLFLKSKKKNNTNSDNNDKKQDEGDKNI